MCCASHQQARLWVQVQYSQRNLPNNSQRKYVQTVHIPKGFAGEYELTPSFPMELKDVQMLSVSPSGMCPSFRLSMCLMPMAQSTFIDNRVQSKAYTTVNSPNLVLWFQSCCVHRKPPIGLEPQMPHEVFLKDTTYINMQTCVELLHCC